MMGETGLPPEMMGGQLTPEMLDMMRREDPLLYQQLVNGGMAPGDELDAIAPPPPGGI